MSHPKNQRPKGYTPAIIRSWIREQMLERGITRMAQIGMGEVTFTEQLASQGTVLTVSNPAPPAVQVAALRGLAALAMPGGLAVNEDGVVESGVILLPAVAAERPASEERDVGPARKLAPRRQRSAKPRPKRRSS